jgi:thiamine-phosphate pyrophosphorylase
LPPLLFFTDPARTPDAEAIAATLPPGSGVVFRAFGADDATDQGRRLAAICRSRGLTLFAGADPRLAGDIGAVGIHLPERSAGRARRLAGRWIVTAAAHSVRAGRRALAAGADAVVVSPVFPSNSPSAGRPVGAVRLALMVRAIGGPVYALGGINSRTARRLANAGLTGLAAVEGFRT